MQTQSYRDLIVWQRSVEMVVELYALTEKFPREELFGIISQMRIAGVSISSNIAEGRSRGTKADYLNFLRTANASGAELETQIEISKRLPKTKSLDYSKVDKLLDEVMRMLNAMIRNFNPKS